MISLVESNANDNIVHYLTEWNSSYSSNETFVKTLNAIINLVEDELKQYPASFQIADKQHIITIPYSLKIYNDNISSTDSGYVKKKQLVIKFFNSTRRNNQINDLFLNGSTQLHDREFTINIGVNIEKTVVDMLNNLHKLRVIISHELVHVFQNLYNNHRKTQAYYNKLQRDTVDGNIFKNPKYWTSNHEVKAYITSISEEMRMLKKDNKSMTFFQAILQCQSWKNLMTFVPIEQKEYLKKAVLSKVAHFWIYSLGGKIDNKIIELNSIIYD